MPINRKHEYLVSLTVYDNIGTDKGVTVGFNARHPDTGMTVVADPDADEEEIDYMIQCLVIVKAHLIARKKVLSERAASHDPSRP